MKTGLLWFDDSQKKTNTDKVTAAARRFLEKFGSMPNLCYANPATTTEPETSVVVVFPNGAKQTVILKQARSILPHHFWLGKAS